MVNAANWSKPGGGYDQWKKGDAAREKALPVGGKAPIINSPLAVPRAFKKGGKVKKTGLALVHKGERVVPAKKKKVKSAAGKSKIKKVMHEWGQGKLHSGSKRGPVVKNQKQAVAIALSQGRKA